MRASSPPSTRYALSGDVSIAYQVVGAGPVDLLWVPGFVSHLDVLWEHPVIAGFLERLASFSRLILFDKRGMGLSDRPDRVATLEQVADDIAAVLDAVGSERPTILGTSEGGPASLLFAAAHPERVASLVLYGTWTRLLRAHDYPNGADVELVRGWIDRQAAGWGAGAGLSGFAPSMAGDERFRAWWGRFQRMGVSPAGLRALFGLYEQIDVRPVLPSVSAATLVLHRRDDQLVPLVHGEYLAEHLPNGRLVVLPGADHVWAVGDADALLDEIEEFVTGARHVHEPDRILATVLFTDIVDSTMRAAELGDRAWRSLLERHDDLVRARVERFRGRTVKTLGDGVLATFDGPGRAVRCAATIVDEARDLGLELRAGLHTGECEAIGDDVGGMAVNIAARVSAQAGAGEVLASGTVRDLVVGSGIAFAERGAHRLKGVPGEWPLHAVVGVA